MDRRHRVLWIAVLTFIAATAACGDVDDGVWVREPGPLPTTPIVEQHTLPSGTTGSVERIELLGAGPSQAHWVRCDMAPEVDFNFRVTGPQVPGYVDTRGWVCMGEPDSANPTLCKQVQAFEARAASVAACFAKMSYLIASRSRDVLGDHWFATVLPMLPEAWSLKPEQVDSLVHRISGGMVELLNDDPDAKTAPGAPLCFPTGSYSPELAKLITAKKMESLIEGTTKNVQAIATALLRGVDVQVTSDLRLTLAARFVEAPTLPIEPVECTFQAP